MTRRILAGLGSLLVLAAMLVGLPAALLAASGIATLHVELTPAGLWHALFRPDDGTLALTLIKFAAWAVWAVFVLLIIVDLVARARHLRAPRLRGLALPQAVTRTLVSSAISLFVAAGSTTAVVTSPPLAVAAPAAPAAPAVREAESATIDFDRPSFRTYTVKKGDTLSEIALDKLGDGRRYPEIFKASTGIRQPRGVRLTDPDVIDIGWTLHVPRRHQPDSPSKPPKEHRENATPPTTRPTPADSAASAPPPAASTGTIAAPTLDEAPESVSQEEQPGWLLVGLSGAGALLAGSLYVLLRRRRQVQFRYRRPGRTIHNPPSNILPVEKTVIRQGQPVADTAMFIDRALRRLAAAQLAAGTDLPDLVAADLTRHQLTLHLAAPAAPPADWRSADDGRTWTTTTRMPDPGDPGDATPHPWPQFVTVGTSDDDRTWLLNLEFFGVVSLTGDRVFAEDLARYLAAELATAPWALDLYVHLLGVAPELVGVNDERLRSHTDANSIDTLVAEAVTIADRCNRTGTASLPTGRASSAGYEHWESRILLTTAEAGGNLPHLIEMLQQMPGRTATTVLLLAGAAGSPTGLNLHLTATGRLQIEALGLDLVPTGLTADEASGCAQLIQAADVLEDEPVPTTEPPEQAWQTWCDDAGLLKAELGHSRDDASPEALTALPGGDQHILETTASVAEELQRIAPVVPTPVSEQMLAADPTLDADLKEWFGDTADRPRLSVLGPMRLRVGRGGQPLESARRRPYYTEILAYLSTKPRGVTTAQICRTFGLEAERIRKDLAITRKWLGTHPVTRARFLPQATESAASHQQGVGLYKLHDVIVDSDLLLRLRARAQARGADGLRDLVTALGLVRGAPYSGMRDGGGTWLLDARDDQHLIVAVLDIAHTAVTAALAAGELAIARRAVDVETLVAPYDETCKLDAAKIARASGNPGASEQLVREVVSACDDDGHIEISPRGVGVLGGQS
jgi:hypothetical protein